MPGGGFPHIEINKMQISQSIEVRPKHTFTQHLSSMRRLTWAGVTVVFFLVFLQAPLTNSDTAVLSGSLSTHNGNGGGNINMTVRRVTSAKGWGEVCKYIQHMNANYNVDVKVIYSILQLLLKKAFSVCCVLDVRLKSMFFLINFLTRLQSLVSVHLLCRWSQVQEIYSDLSLG